MSDEIKAKWKLWNDKNYEDKSLAYINIQGVKFMCPKKIDDGNHHNEENYFHAREVFRYIVNDKERLTSIMTPLGYDLKETTGAKLGLLNEIAKYYHTDQYTYSSIKRDVGREIVYLDNEAWDLIKSISTTT